jgi:Cof subfamily protein (haloacid dehalogenase superfamily)
MAPARFRILALDVDGTLLDPDGTLRPRTAEAITRASRAGIRPVLCTGRRYRRAWPIARQLGVDAPLICNSGAIIKNPGDHLTLWRGDFGPDLAGAVLDLFQIANQPAVIFTDRTPDQSDFVIGAYPTGREFFDDYVAQNHEHAEIRPELNSFQQSGTAELRTQLDLGAVFHVCALGTRSEMLAFQNAALKEIDGRIQTFVQGFARYRGTMCEILRHDASKWRAILHVAESWGVLPGEICAVGDDANDIPMIRNAGLGVAMGHAAREVQDAADLITGDHDDDGVAMLVDDVLLA